MSKVGALRRTTEVVPHREGGDPSSNSKSPGRTEYEAITLERGITHDMGFENRITSGMGLKVLFNGASGTGKIMTAGVIARGLGLDLYKIDLSSVVSKYIGETEKNLNHIFQATHCSNAILFFDEADALFGKRTEIKDSHDRYANLEVNYLLQRMEEYRGLAILATNNKTALDYAFLRRIRFIANFPFPDAANRQLIWEKAFPKKVPVNGLVCDALARL